MQPALAVASKAKKYLRFFGQGNDAVFFGGEFLKLEKSDLADHPPNRSCQNTCTRVDIALPETNIAPENTPSQKETTHQFSGAMLVSGRVTFSYVNFDPFRLGILFPTLRP